MAILSDLPADALLTLFNHVVAAANTGQLLKLALVSHMHACTRTYGCRTACKFALRCCIQEVASLDFLALRHHVVPLVVCHAQVCRQFLNVVAQADWFWQQQCTTLGWLR
jgi:hypothetical protein